MKQTFFKKFTVNTIPQKKVDVDSKAGKISSDGGLILFSSWDNSLGITEEMAECITDHRQEGKRIHSVRDLLKQKVLSLIAGYEDQNDHNRLRKDDIMQVSMGKEEELASQSSMSRFENGVSIKEIIQMNYKLVEQFVKLYKEEPKEITLDIDPTDAETHGRQQGTMFHGFFMQYQYYPLLVFCNGVCIGALLREGTASASKYTHSMLTRIIKRIRSYWPDVEIKIRGDCGFGNPKMYKICEKKGLSYVLGIASNNVLQEEVEELIRRVKKDYKDKTETQKRFKSFRYRAGSWDRDRSIIAKVERTKLGINTRYIVISGPARKLPEEEAKQIYGDYVQRGVMEVSIDDWKNALNSDRMSCSKFKANWFRLILHTIAYNLMVLAKKKCKHKIPEIAQASLHTIRLFLVKIGAIIRRLKTRVKIHLSSSFPHLDVFWRVKKLLL